MANIIQINGFGLSGGGSDFPYTGSAIISGSLVVTGSTTSTLGFTGSIFGTSSWANNAITASFLQNNDPNGFTLNVVKGITLQVTDASVGSINLQAKNITFSGSAGSTTITSYGNILPGGPYTNNTSSFNLGSPTAAWKDIYVSNGSINFISGSASSSIQFNNGQITFPGANLTIPSGSTVLTASFATNATNAVNATNASNIFVSDQNPSTNNWSIPIIEGSGGGNSLLHAVGPTYDPTTGYYFPAKGQFSGPVTASGFSGIVTHAITASYFNNGVSFAGSGSIITGSTAISSSYGLLVPANTFTVGDQVKVQGVFLKPNGATATNFFIYINTANQLSGATQVALYNTTTVRWVPITRTLSINSPTKTQTYAAATAHYNDDIVITTGFNVSNLNIDWTVDQYFLFAASNASAADRTDTLRFYAKKI